MRKVAGLAAVAAVLAGYLLFGDRRPAARMTVLRAVTPGW